MVKIKICGITNMDDALFAARSGADYLGFVFAKSKRRVTPLSAKKIIQKLPKRIKTVGVFVNEDHRKINAIAKYCKLDIVQLHGDERPVLIKKIKPDVIKAFRIKSMKDIGSIKKYKNVYAVLLDSYVKGRRGGTGEKFNWDIAKNVVGAGIKVFLAGGVSPNNVKKAIKYVKPFAVDSSSCLERSIGVKDHKKVRALIRKARS